MDGSLGSLGASFPANASASFPMAASAEPCRPLCEAGIDSPGSTSLKWGSDGELTAQDLHHVMARLLACDPEAHHMIEPGSGA